MADPTDAQVLARVRQGDYHAYTLLFERYYSPVEQYAHCLLGESSAAGAAASATFEQGFREARRRQTDAMEYPAYLFVLCRRFALRAGLRHNSPAFSLRAAPNLEEFGPSTLDELPLSVILYGERDTLVRSALNSLGIEDREIIHLAFEPVLQRADVGLILKEPRESVLTAHLFRALRRLGAAIHQTGRATPEFTEGRPNYVPRWTRT